MLKPRAVRPGSRIAVVAPASSAKQERIDGGIAALRKLGFDVVPGKHLEQKAPPYFAGTAEERLADLHAAFADPSIEAIICSRGGYGSNYLLEGLDLELIRRNPKPFFAYSDMTAMQTWLLDQAGLVSFHGPMTAADFYLEEGVHLPSFQAALRGEGYTLGGIEGLRMLQGGRARGTLYGGCLSILTASLGTSYAPQTVGKLLFLEDVGAKPYQVDRMLRHLMLAGKFEGVTGIVFGEMLECASPGAGDKLLEEVILRVLDWFPGPIGIGLRSGHVSRGNVTLMFGVEAELNLEGDPELHMLEPGVIA